MRGQGRHAGIKRRVAHAVGFTLVEMLVTMTLTAMVAGLLWQAMHQITRVERLLQGEGVGGQLDLVRREWLRSLIQSALVEQIGATRQFIGDAHELSLASSESLAMPGANGPRLHLSLDSDAATGRQRLMITQGSHDLTSTKESATATELLSWAGNEGRFQYLNLDGAWIGQWPPPKSAFVPTGDPEVDFRRQAQAALPRLPRAVWLNLGPEIGGALVIEVSATQAGRGRLAQWEQQ